MDGGPDDQLAQCTTGASHRFRWNDLPDDGAKDLPQSSGATVRIRHEHAHKWYN